MTDQIIFPYVFQKKIGEGGYGKIYRVKNKISGKTFACKLLKNSKSFNEINFMLKLKDETNVITFHECYNISSNRLAIIMEECNGPNIFDAVRTIRDHDERSFYRKQYISQSISAIKACHKNMIIHKDIKHTNFILKENKKDSIVKLIDFGLSELDSGNIICKTCGTLRYMPPEGFAGINHSRINTSAYLTPSYDIWSLGIMIYLLYTGIDVFKSPNEQTVINNITNGLISKSLNHRNIKNTKVSTLVKKMLHTAPMMRPTINQVQEIFEDINN